MFHVHNPFLQLFWFAEREPESEKCNAYYHTLFVKRKANQGA